MDYHVNTTAYNELQDMKDVSHELNESLSNTYEYLIRRGPDYDALYTIRKFSIPLICVFGVFGNTLSLCLFLKKCMRNSSCNLYLAARSLSDTGFLITLFFVWLDFMDVPVFNKDGVCQVLLFISYISSFISVWCVLVITFENYIRICHVTEVKKFCNTKVAKLVITTGIILSLFFYNFPLWGTNVREVYGKQLCLTLEQYVDLEMIFTIIDTFLTLILPILTMLILLILIVYDSSLAAKRSKRLNRNSGDNHRHCPQKRKRPSHHERVTRLLTFVSVTFIVLHTPNHVIRLKVILEVLLGTKVTTTETERTLQQIFITMSYLNFSINSLLYLFCGQRFRNEFRNLVCKLTHYCTSFNPD